MSRSKSTVGQANNNNNNNNNDLIRLIVMCLDAAKQMSSVMFGTSVSSNTHCAAITKKEKHAHLIPKKAKDHVKLVKQKVQLQKAPIVALELGIHATRSISFALIIKSQRTVQCTHAIQRKLKTLTIKAGTEYCSINNTYMHSAIQVKYNMLLAALLLLLLLL